MEFKDMNTDELLERKSAIADEIESEGADLNALEEEVRGINDELEARKAEEAQKVEIREMIAAEEVPAEPMQTMEIKTEERKVMTLSEIRNSAEYIDAFAEYIKSGDDAECRALLSENATGGTVPVPEFVYEMVKTAWEKEGIMSRVRKAYLRGVVKVGFEISGDDAIVHEEGGAAIDPENLILGTVTMTPASIKKAVQISDEVYDLRGEAFLRYIYDELTYKIAKKAADTLIAKIEACGTVSTTTCPGVPKIVAATVSMGTIAEAIAQLSDDAANPVIMMNKLTWAEFKKVQYANGYAADPFEGLPVEFNNTIKAYSAASTGDAYVIVGDLDQGALANFPNGEGITFKFDDLSLKKQDLIEVFGRQYVALGVVAQNAFCKITK